MRCRLACTPSTGLPPPSSRGLAGLHFEPLVQTGGARIFFTEAGADQVEQGNEFPQPEVELYAMPGVAGVMVRGGTLVVDGVDVYDRQQSCAASSG